MRIVLPLLAASLVGCSSSPLTAPYGSDVSWETTSFATEVGLGCDYDREPDYNGYLMLNTVMVVNDDDMPLERIQLSVRADAPAGVYVLPQEAVKTVDFPAADEEVTSQADVKASCVDENGNFDNTNEWCAWYWDEGNSQYYQFGEDYADAGGYAPTYFIGQTDGRGLMQVYVFFDCVYGESTVTASVGVANDVLTISAEDADSG